MRKEKEVSIKTIGKSTNPANGSGGAFSPYDFENNALNLLDIIDIARKKTSIGYRCPARQDAKNGK